MSPDSITKCVELFERFVVSQERVAAATEGLLEVQKWNNAINELEAKCRLGVISAREAFDNLGK